MTPQCVSRYLLGMTIELWISEELNARLRNAAGADGMRENVLRSCIDERLGGASVVATFEQTKRENCFRARIELEAESCARLDALCSAMMIDESAKAADAPTKFYGRAWALDREIDSALKARGH